MDLRLRCYLLIGQKMIFYSSKRLKISKKPILTSSVTFQLTELKKKDGLASLVILMKRNLNILCQLIPEAFFSQHVDLLIWSTWSKFFCLTNSTSMQKISSDSDHPLPSSSIS